MQAAAPEALIEPAAQVVQLPAPSELKVPAEQEVQLPAPPRLKVPAEQAVQLPALSRLKVPAEQTVQDVGLVLGSVGSVAPALNDPAPQGRQVFPSIKSPVVIRTLYSPGVHTMVWLPPEDTAKAVL